MAVILVKHEFEGDAIFDQLLLWVIPVIITNGEKTLTLKLLLDTGAQKTVVVPRVQQLLNIVESNKTQQGSGVSGNANYSVAEVDNLEIGSISLGSVELLIGAVPQPFAKYKISGLLGADILKMLCITLDYPQKLLVIEKTIVLP